MTDAASKTAGAAVVSSSPVGPVLPDPADPTGVVFVSHSSRDAQAASAVVNALEAAGVGCWIAPRDIPPGSDYNSAIMAGINGCRVMLLVLSRHSADSDPVAREVERAMNRRVPVIPARLEPAAPSPGLEYMISASQWVDAFPPPLDRHLDAVVAAVKKVLRLAHDAPRPDPNAPPKYVGPYRILEPLGQGGMGTVYRAEQRSPVKRSVAIKLIKPGFDSSEVIARFESERQALARMDHPNVAKVLDAGTDALGRPYFVMEYVPGVPITQYADDNKLTVRQRLELFTQACDAIAHAHTKALIHRDIKAGNVLAYTADGKPRVKVIDFGIAKALTGDRLTDRTFNTQRGQAIGTYESMSPEQADGSPDIDTRTDVYSLGVLLYELLAGAKPFDSATLAQAADAEMRRIIREVEPPRPSTRLSSLGSEGTKIAAARQARVDALARELRSELEWIPLKAMRKERERRYASPLELASDIQNYLEHRPLAAGPESAAYRLRKLAARNKAPIAAAAAILLTLVVGVAVSTTLYLRARRLADANGRLAVEKTRLAADMTRLAVENGTLASQKSAAADLAASRLAESLLAQGDAAVAASRWSDAGRLYREARDIQRGLGLPTMAAEFGLANVLLVAPPPLVELNAGGVAPGPTVPVTATAVSNDGHIAAAGFADGKIALWALPSGRRLATLIGHRRDVSGLAVSPDGRHLLSTAGDDTMRLWDVARGAEEGSAPARFLAAAWSPDGSQLAICSGGGCWLWKTGPLTQLKKMGDASGSYSVTFTADGRKVLWSTGTRVAEADVAGGEVVYYAGLPIIALSIAVSPDGNEIICGTGRAPAGTVFSLDRRSHQLAAIGAIPAATQAVAIDSGGIVAASDDGAVRQWDVKSKKQSRIAWGQFGPLEHVALCPAANLALSGGQDGVLRVWDTGPSPRLLPHKREVTAVALSPDARLALTGTGDGSTKLWDTATCQPIPLPRQDATAWRVSKVAFSPDGQIAMSARDYDALLAWWLPRDPPGGDAGPKDAVVPLKFNHAGVRAVAFTADSRRVLTADGNTVCVWDIPASSNGLPPEPALFRKFRNFATLARGIALTKDPATAIGMTVHGQVEIMSLAFGISIPNPATLSTPNEPLELEESVVFDSAGAQAGAGNGHDVLLWSLPDRKITARLQGHRGRVLCLAMSRDFRRAVSGGDDGTVRVWDVPTGRQLCVLSTPAALIQAVDCSRDGRIVASGDDEGIVRLWDLDLAAESEKQMAQLADARRQLDSRSDDPEFLSRLGSWYAFRGRDDWAIELLEQARAGGASVSPLMLARCCWRIGRLRAAATEFEAAISRQEAPEAYLRLCLGAVEQEMEGRGE